MFFVQIQQSHKTIHVQNLHLYESYIKSSSIASFNFPYSHGRRYADIIQTAGWEAAILETEHMCVSNERFIHCSKRWPNPGSKVDSLQPSAERPQRPGQSPEGKHTHTQKNIILNGFLKRSTVVILQFLIIFISVR